MKLDKEHGFCSRRKPCRPPLQGYFDPCGTHVVQIQSVPYLFHTIGATLLTRKQQELLLFLHERMKES
ncbi:MAG: hypothetical protein ACK4N1_17525, partial [Pseudorhizobium sp.]